MVDSPTAIGDRIEALVEEEQALWAEPGELGEEGHARLAEIREELDRCWILLRLRRADRDSDIPRDIR